MVQLVLHNPLCEQGLTTVVVGASHPLHAIIPPRVVCHFLGPALCLGSGSGVWGRRTCRGGSEVHLFTTFPQSRDLFTTYGIMFGNIIWPYSSVVMLCEMAYVGLCKVVGSIPCYYIIFST